LLWPASLYFCLFLGGVDCIDFDSDFLPDAAGAASIGDSDCPGCTAAISHTGTADYAY
jgi:hypothetical protein